MSITTFGRDQRIEQEMMMADQCNNEAKLLDPYLCKCGNEIGVEVEIKSVVYIRCSGLILREAHGYCLRCGLPFHWSIPDRIMERMVKRWSER